MHLSLCPSPRLRLLHGFLACLTLLGFSLNSPLLAKSSTLLPQLAPGSLSAHALTLVWDKPEAFPAGTQYQVLCDGRPAATTPLGFTRLDKLEAGRPHRLKLIATSETGGTLAASEELVVELPPEGRVLRVQDFGAKGDGHTLDTKAIQAAIDACPTGGAVRLENGTFLAGALFLKSDMTLDIAEGTTLKGSDKLADYGEPAPNRFEGWELKTYNSLLNAGTLDRGGRIAVRNLHIIGKGRISGGGPRLGEAMTAAHGQRSRSRLICLMNCDGVELQGLQICDSPCWTIHYIYSRNLTCEDLNIESKVRNGDGLDPDSSFNSYILNCRFDTGDDCIAIKSGKNPEGNVVNIPTEKVRVLGCRFDRGHGISIGSEISGGIRDVLVQDCQAGPLINGMQIKGTKDRGAFVEDITVRDCELQKITVLTKLNYNNDGAPAAHAPLFRRFHFSHIDLTKADARKPVIIVQGYEETGHRTQDVLFEDIRLPAGAIIEVSQSERVRFSRVNLPDGGQAAYKIKDCDQLEY